MNGKVVLVTGSTDGIGKQTALELVRLGANVVIHGRNQQKVASVTKELAARTGKNFVGLVADLSKMGEVAQLARHFQDRFSTLDVLLHNAGVFMQTRELTPDGFEMTLAVNHLAPFLLTRLLLPSLEKTPGARVITVSSMTHRNGLIDTHDLHAEHGYAGYGAYANSKLANVLFAFELAERVASRQITSNCLHPGVIDTKLLRQGFGMGGASLEEGARTSVFLASSNEVASVSGKYFVNQKVSEVSPLANDVELRRELWAKSEQLVEPWLHQ